jgi:hypothetical protein
MIGANAFWDASIDYIYLPTSITAIHESSFWGYTMNLRSILVEHGERERFESILSEDLRKYILELPNADVELPF